MALARVIPVLLLRSGGLYKTVRFQNPTYVGDPINAVRIFNDKECDELILLDIEATRESREIDFDQVRDVFTEAFMPMCYGGGIRSIDDVEGLFTLGVEKVSLNTAAVEDPGLVELSSERFGAQSIVISIDVKHRRLGGDRVFIRGGAEDSGLDPVDHAKRMEAAGAGEILLTSIDREGTGKGYDSELIRAVAEAVDIPVVANGGAGRMEDLAEVVHDAGAAGAAAGSMFVFHGKHRAVLINYPGLRERRRWLDSARRGD